MVEEASVFLQERGCRAKSTWKSREMGDWCKQRLQRARIELQKNLHSALLEPVLTISAVISRVGLDLPRVSQQL